MTQTFSDLATRPIYLLAPAGRLAFLRLQALACRR